MIILSVFIPYASILLRHPSHARLLTSPHTSTSTNGVTMPYTKYSFLVKFSLMMSFPMISKNSFIAVLCFKLLLFLVVFHEDKIACCRDGTRTRNRRKTQLTLHRQHDTPYICIASPKPSELFCLYRHPFLSSFAFFCFVHSVAIVSQPFSQRLTSHLPSALHYYLSASP